MDSNDVLRRFHARLPGASRGVFGADGPGGGASYRRLADAVVEGPVLDLGCGDGTLLELIAARGFDVSGADMSPEELAIARRRLGEGVPLHLGDARKLPVPDAAYATVVSHMAFMLMNPIDDIVAEVARVLRPGGTFVATVGRQGEPTDASHLFFVKLRDLLRGEGVPAMQLFDDRTHDAAGLVSLFAAPAWTGFEHEEFSFPVQVPADRMGAWFEAAYYPVDLLSSAGRAELHAWLHAERDRMAPGGSMTWTFAARQFVVRRATP